MIIQRGKKIFSFTVDDIYGIDTRNASNTWSQTDFDDTIKTEASPGANTYPQAVIPIDGRPVTIRKGDLFQIPFEFFKIKEQNDGDETKIQVYAYQSEITAATQYSDYPAGTLLNDTTGATLTVESDTDLSFNLLFPTPFTSVGNFCAEADKKITDVYGFFLKFTSTELDDAQLRVTGSHYMDINIGRL